MADKLIALGYTKEEIDDKEVQTIMAKASRSSKFDESGLLSPPFLWTRVLTVVNQQTGDRRSQS